MIFACAVGVNIIVLTQKIIAQDMKIGLKIVQNMRMKMGF